MPKRGGVSKLVLPSSTFQSKGGQLPTAPTQNNRSYKNLLEKSKLPSLKIRRLKTIVVETFKIIHKNSPIYLHLIIETAKC
jgi:hypothetical protein